VENMIAGVVHGIRESQRLEPSALMSSAIYEQRSHWSLVVTDLRIVGIGRNGRNRS
jgi:hypothetical protein